MWAVPSSAWSVPMVSPGGSVGGGGGGGSKTPAWRRPSTSRTNATATTPPTTSGFIRPPPPPPERRLPGARFCFSRRSRRVVTVTARPEYRPRLDLEMSVRLRFAPSPTGALHIGSVRTILQLPLRPAARWHARPPHRGHRPGAPRNGRDRLDLRRTALAWHQLGRRPAGRRPARAVRPVRAAAAVPAARGGARRKGRGLLLLLLEGAPRGAAQAAGGATRAHALRPPLPEHPGGRGG